MPRLKSVKITADDFMCSCSNFEKDAEGNYLKDAVTGWAIKSSRESDGERKCRLVMEEVLRILDTDRENLLSAVVYSLEWRYRAYIASILSDQWAAVGSATYPDDDPDKITTYIQCDRVEDGIAATFLFYYQQFGEERPRISTPYERKQHDRWCRDYYKEERPDGCEDCRAWDEAHPES